MSRRESWRTRANDAEIEAGRLQHKVLFQRRVLTPVGDQQDIGWEDAFTANAEATRRSEQNAQFIIRYRAGIGPDTHRAIYWGAIWTITDAVSDHRNTFLTIDSDFSALIEATHLQSTEREFISGLPVVRPPSDS